jgi:hypothetical protein
MRLTKAIGWIVLFLSALTACGSTAANISGQADNGSGIVAASANGSAAETKLKETKMSETAIKAVSMTATAENTPAGLVVNYVVENHTDQNVYLWDMMIGYDDGKQKIDHDSAYVFFAEPKTVRIIRAELPLPKTFDIARKEIPFARVLAAKSKLTGTIKLKHPVTEFSPYYPPPAEDATKVVKCGEVELLISWTPAKQGMQITERTVGGEKVFAIRGAWAPPYQEILQETMHVPVDLTIYTSPFERMLPIR